MSPAIDRANSSAAVRIEKLIAAADGYAKHMAASKTEWGGATRYRVELLPVKSGKWLQRRRTCTTPMEANRLLGSDFFVSETGIYFTIDHDAGHGSFYRQGTTKDLPQEVLEWIAAQ